jgi:hypothetical protein
MEVERDHVLGDRSKEEGLDDRLLEAARRRRDEASEQPPGFTAVAATAELDQVIFDGTSFGTPVLTGTPEEQDFLGLPGLLTSKQVAALLAKRQAEQLATQRARQTGEPVGEPAAAAKMTAGQRRQALRKQLNTLVAAEHHRTGRPHGQIHAELRRLCGGPPSAQATIEQLESRIATIRSW